MEKLNICHKIFEYFKYKIHTAITNHLSKQLNNTGQFKHEGTYLQFEFILLKAMLDNSNKV